MPSTTINFCTLLHHLSIHLGNFAAKYHLKLLKLFSGRYPTKNNRTVQNVVYKASTRG